MAFLVTVRRSENAEMHLVKALSARHTLEQLLLERSGGPFVSCMHILHRICTCDLQYEPIDVHTK